MVAAVLELYRNGSDPFDRPSAKLPQDPSHMPQTLVDGSLEHRLFLWRSNYYMRGGMDSNEAFKMLSKLFDWRPEFFDPYYIVQQADIEELRSCLIEVGLKLHQNSIPSFWFENDQRLVDLYEGDPGNIFRDISTYDEACARIQNDGKGGGFKGFQKKMVSMVIYYFMDAGFIDPFHFPVPVDLHIARLTLSNEVIKVYGAPPGWDLLAGGRDDRILDIIRDFYMWCATEGGYDPLEMCSALWMYSRLKCSDNVEAVWSVIQEGNRNSVFERIEPDWHNPTTVRKYMRSCGSCVLSSTCKWNFGHAPFYKVGAMWWGDPRLGAPEHASGLLSFQELQQMHRYVPPTKARTAIKKITHAQPSLFDPD